MSGRAECTRTVYAIARTGALASGAIQTRARLGECWSDRRALHLGKCGSELALRLFIEPRLRQCCARLTGDMLIAVEIETEIAAR